MQQFHDAVPYKRIVLEVLSSETFLLQMQNQVHNCHVSR